jgi:hypothetical protein
MMVLAGSFAYAQGRLQGRISANNDAQLQSPQISQLTTPATLIFSYWKTAIPPILDVSNMVFEHFLGKLLLYFRFALKKKANHCVVLTVFQVPDHKNGHNVKRLFHQIRCHFELAIT